MIVRKLMRECQHAGKVHGKIISRAMRHLGNMKLINSIRNFPKFMMGLEDMLYEHHQSHPKTSACVCAQISKCAYTVPMCVKKSQDKILKLLQCC